METKRMTRQQMYAKQIADKNRQRETNMQRWEHVRQRSASYGDGNSNVMGPQEDVVASRKTTRNRVNVSTQHNPESKNLLTENIILLILLVGSIIGLYKLSLYLLNQA
ncbi:MAG: hypothetical protein J1E42_06535 [Akkermansiaceae bacterium]|nr:hypothetical protein [Akkermansiaceae bacterium]